MKPLTLIVSALLLCCAAQAEVIIYKQSYTQTESGLGLKTTTKLTGYFILDDQGSDLFQIDVNAKTKTFQVFEYWDYSVRNIELPQGKHKLVIAFYFWEEGGIVIKGVNSVVDLGTTSMTIPKAMDVSGTALGGTDPDSGELEFKGRLTFDKNATAACNLAGRDIVSAVDTLRASLQAKGYTELVP